MSNTISMIGSPPFVGNFLAASSSGKYGYVDQYYNIQIPFIFDWAFPFVGDVAKVVVNNKYGLINKSGSYLCVPKYDVIEEFNGSYAVTRLNDLFGYIDKNGKEISPNKFVNAKPFVDGIAVVGIKGDRAWSDPSDSFRIVVSPTGSNSADSDQGYYYHRTFLGTIDTTGRQIIEPKFLILSDQYQGRHVGMDLKDQHCIVDTFGNKVSRGAYLHLYLLSHGYVHAVIEKKSWLGKVSKKHGIIDLDENIIEDFDYDGYSYTNKKGFELIKNGKRKVIY